MGLNKPLTNGMKNSSHIFYKLASLKIRVDQNVYIKKAHKK
jgi:hypothetical protein